VMPRDWERHSRSLHCACCVAVCITGIWGQHLVVVPTSVMINWEMEFKRWLPGFKILSYHGSAKQRQEKRRGWSDPNSFHVCITSYQLILQDRHIFRRKRWQYLILDEVCVIIYLFELVNIALADAYWLFTPGSSHQELCVTAMASADVVPNEAPAAADRHTASEQHDGAVVPDALPHAARVSVANGIQGLTCAIAYTYSLAKRFSKWQCWLPSGVLTVVFCGLFASP